MNYPDIITISTLVAILVKGKAMELNQYLVIAFKNKKEKAVISLIQDMMQLSSRIFIYSRSLRTNLIHTCSI